MQVFDEWDVDLNGELSKKEWTAIFEDRSKKKSSRPPTLTETSTNPHKET